MTDISKRWNCENKVKPDGSLTRITTVLAELLELDDELLRSEFFMFAKKSWRSGFPADMALLRMDKKEEIPLYLSREIMVQLSDQLQFFIEKEKKQYIERVSEQDCLYVARAVVIGRAWANGELSRYRNLIYCYEVQHEAACILYGNAGLNKLEEDCRVGTQVIKIADLLGGEYNISLLEMRIGVFRCVFKSEHNRLKREGDKENKKSITLLYDPYINRVDVLKCKIDEFLTGVYYCKECLEMHDEKNGHCCPSETVFHSAKYCDGCNTIFKKSRVIHNCVKRKSSEISCSHCNSNSNRWPKGMNDIPGVRALGTAGDDDPFRFEAQLDYD